MKWLTFSILIGLSCLAHAEEGTEPLSALNPHVVVSPVTVMQGDGVKVGEGTSIYPQFGVETGFISNVFYESNDPVGSALMRIIAEIGAGSLSPQRRRYKNGDSGNGSIEELTQPAEIEANGDFAYSANLYAKWDQYLSDNKNVTDQGGLGLGAYLRAVVNPQKPLRFTVVDNYDRILRATNFESNVDTNRHVNVVDLTLGYFPRGRSLNGFLRYSNRIDYFEEDEFQFSNRLQNLLTLRVAWKFLPLTQTYVQVSQGLNSPLGGESEKVSSYPLNALVGIDTAITPNTGVAARVGYTQGFYSEGPDYQNVTGGLMFDYRYSPLGRFRFRYDFIYADSINANFYRDHAFQAWFEQRVSLLGVFASPEIRLRRYEGVLGAGMSGPTRDDLIVAAAVGARYQFRAWLLATVQYLLTVDQTDYRYIDSSGSDFDPSYVRHELYGGLRIAY